MRYPFLKGFQGITNYQRPGTTLARAVDSRKEVTDAPRTSAQASTLVREWHCEYQALRSHRSGVAEMLNP